MYDTTIAAGVMKLYADSALFFALMMQSYTALMLALLAQTATLWLKGFLKIPFISVARYTPIVNAVKAPRVLSR